MDDLRAEAMRILASLSDEQVLLVLAYARCLKDGEGEIAVAGNGLEELLEESA